MVELNEKALEAAWYAGREARGMRRAPPDEAGLRGLREAIGAYLSALPAPDDGLVERLLDPDYAGELQHLRSWSEIDRLFREAATALQSKDEQIERLTWERGEWIERCRAAVIAFDEQKARAEAAEQQVQKLTAENERLMGASNTPAATIRPEVKSEREILKRLAAGDEIAFSQDGDDAFFTKGDRAFVGRVIISMRSKGYLKRISLDDENYRGLSERDVISDAGLAALETQEAGNKQ